MTVYVVSCYRQGGKTVAVACGYGFRTRNRTNEMPGRCSELTNFNCRHSLNAKERCNMGCPNAGIPTTEGCKCQEGFKGKCCFTG